MKLLPTPLFQKNQTTATQDAAYSYRVPHSGGTMGPLAGNDNILDGESKYSKDSDFDFDRREKNFAMNGNKPPPQPATAAVNSIHWDVEEGRF